MVEYLTSKKRNDHTVSELKDEENQCNAITRS
jgi:hypothetical protein